ncbi:hypothetical protein A2W54_01845 [Candidatus Giovannonibacteria bacterium RIFCSPHIGHO2_02_43_13]|uniref:Uncharacterized protein n=1 Tax=Candidatus Giovannonibacteria bacterium RIFCSPHIGHO2_02_43_13 TaxID=1798330 RepID=A0A1F5WTK8_9BACT|nr:MAG: hypothetical protein A2W54_01845 [Candidatus Giovannonibacteria bacterium RIFCSPHIGHO2_02_43_13]
MNLSNEEITKKIKSLPQDLQDAFFSDEVSQNIIDIGKKHGLMLDKVGILGDETTLIMLGITPTADFIKNLSERLGVDKEKAKAIAEDINQKVFQQVRASLRKVHGLPEGERVKVKKPAENLSGIQAGRPAAPVVPLLVKEGVGGGIEIPKAPIEPKPGEVRPSSPIFAKRIVPIDELLDKIDSGESIIKPKVKIENVPPPPVPTSSIRTMFNDVKSAVSEAPKAEVPMNLPVETNLSPDEIKSAVEKALGGKITTKDTNDPYREPPI